MAYAWTDWQTQMPASTKTVNWTKYLHDVQLLVQCLKMKFGTWNVSIRIFALEREIISLIPVTHGNFLIR